MFERIVNKRKKNFTKIKNKWICFIPLLVLIESVRNVRNQSVYTNYKLNERGIKSQYIKKKTVQV